MTARDVAKFFESKGKAGRLPDDALLLTVAQKYGQSPGEVERWEQRHFNAAVLMLEGENIYSEREMDKVRSRH